MGRFAKLSAALSLVLALAGCATPAPLLTSSVGTLREGLGETREQSAAAFRSINDSARRLDIERVLAKPAPTLQEADFPVALATEDVDGWSKAFSALDAYLATLQGLADPARSAATGAAFDDLAKEFTTGAAGAKLPGAATAAFSTFASTLVQARAERTATDVMRRTDASFTAVMAGMADAVGADDDTGVRGTARGYWQGTLSDIRAQYAAIDPSATDSRRAAILQFTAAMDARRSQLADLEALRVSLLALGEAHAAAARGSQGDALFWIGRIDGWLDDAKRRAAEAGGAKK